MKQVTWKLETWFSPNSLILWQLLNFKWLIRQHYQSKVFICSKRKKGLTSSRGKWGHTWYEALLNRALFCFSFSVLLIAPSFQWTPWRTLTRVQRWSSWFILSATLAFFSLIITTIPTSKLTVNQTAEVLIRTSSSYL